MDFERYIQLCCDVYDQIYNDDRHRTCENCVKICFYRKRNNCKKFKWNVDELHKIVRREVKKNI